MYDTWHFSY